MITVYIDLIGDDSLGDGTEEKPWRSFEKAASALVDAGGGTLIVGPGLWGVRDVELPGHVKIQGSSE